MNQQELNEIKRNLKTTSPWLGMGGILTAYIKVTSLERQIAFSKVRPFEELTTEEADIHLKMLKKVLSCKLGRNGRLLTFRDDEQGEMAKESLYRLRNSRLQNPELVDAFLEEVKEHAGFDESFYVTCLFCDYVIPKKDKNDEHVAEEESGRVPFLVCSFNLASLTEIGLVFDPVKGEVIKKNNEEMQIKERVLDGFLYPTINQSAADLDQLLYYTYKANEPNEVMQDELFCANPDLCQKEETNVFHSFVENMYQSDISFQAVGRLQDELLEVINLQDEQEDAIELDKEGLKALMTNAKTAPEVMERFEQAITNTLEDQSIYAINAMEAAKVMIDAGGIKISAPVAEKDRIKSGKVDGRFCLTIELNGQLNYNGFEVTPSEKGASEAGSKE